MHRTEVEQIAGHNFRTHVAQSLRTCVFISDHRTHGFALLQQQFGNFAPYRADAARGAGDQNGIRNVFSLMGSSLRSFVSPFSILLRGNVAAFSRPAAAWQRDARGSPVPRKNAGQYVLAVVVARRYACANRTCGRARQFGALLRQWR
jgi:hypothetical protein